MKSTSLVWPRRPARCRCCKCYTWKIRHCIYIRMDWHGTETFHISDPFIMEQLLVLLMVISEIFLYILFNTLSSSWIPFMSAKIWLKSSFWSWYDFNENTFWKLILSLEKRVVLDNKSRFTLIALIDKQHLKTSAKTPSAETLRCFWGLWKSKKTLN